MSIKALLLAGPTAVGKTDISLELASRFFPSQFEIISADSVQVYRYLDIGSGKLPIDRRRDVHHYLIDEVLPDYLFDAASFCERADVAVQTIESHGRVPFFVGGAGLYLESFFKGLSPVPDIDPAIRTALMAEHAAKGISMMYEELQRIDVESAARIHPNDMQRVLRALQVYRGTGKTLTWYRSNKKPRETEKTLYIGISCDRSELDRRIEKRVDGMMTSGFLDEVASLVEKGYTLECNAMRSIGYRELCNYLDGKTSLTDAVGKIKSETREYAKRQVTWFRREKRMRWFDYRDIGGIVEAVSAWAGSDSTS
ncbi:MAG TPA: tRNA (adenosine(37)-N6)-dimethylallyltransferase MiaA [Spirochaetota bacterium]